MLRIFSTPQGQKNNHRCSTITTYDYDLHGNLEQITQGTDITLFEYNGLGRLSDVTLPDSTTIAYTYDADGRRLSQTVNSTDTTTYLWDEFSTYGDVVQTSTATEDVTYTTGLGLVLAQSTATEDLYLYHDGQGSTRALADASGNIIQEYTYTAFGELYNPPATLLTDYLYAGQQYDELTGLYNLRARQYDPALGRFLGRDTYPIDYQNPVELNRYVYVANNPINMVDPSGLFASISYTEAHKPSADVATGGVAFTGTYADLMAMPAVYEAVPALVTGGSVAAESSVAAAAGSSITAGETLLVGGITIGGGLVAGLISILLVAYGPPLPEGVINPNPCFNEDVAEYHAMYELYWGPQPKPSSQAEAGTQTETSTQTEQAGTQRGTKEQDRQEETILFIHLTTKEIADEILKYGVKVVGGESSNNDPRFYTFTWQIGKPGKQIPTKNEVELMAGMISRQLRTRYGPVYQDVVQIRLPRSIVEQFIEDELLIFDAFYKDYRDGSGSAEPYFEAVFYPETFPIINQYKSLWTSQPYWPKEYASGG